MGEIAALVTAIFWAFTSIFFTAAGRQVGSVIVNRVRLFLATIFLFITHFVFFKELIPSNAGTERWIWFALSGIIGLSLGDTFLFQTYVLIGNRLGTLLMASAPIFATIGAWLFLGEVLNFYDILGISLCLLGISMVILERGKEQNNNKSLEKKDFIIGVLFGFASAICQAAGLILAKKGLSDNFPPLSGTVMRTLAATITIWLITMFLGKTNQTISAVKDNPEALRNILGGVFFGPFLGVWLSLIAVQLAPVGIASTLMALSPLILLPIAKWGFKEKVSLNAACWTLTAICGTSIIFLLG